MKKIIPLVLTLLVIYSCNQDEVPQLQNNDCYLCGTWKRDSIWDYINNVKQPTRVEGEDITHQFTIDTFKGCRNDLGVISCESYPYVRMDDTVNIVYGQYLIDTKTESELVLKEFFYTDSVITFGQCWKYHKL